VFRISFYSHDTFGLGHTSRVAKLANAIVRALPDSRCLIVTGLDSAGLIRLSPGIDFVRMPGVTKIGVEHYRARSLRMPAPAIARIRTGVLQAAIANFDPHLFVVDNVPQGLNGEARPVLESIRSRNGRVPIILLMRDILDSVRRIVEVWSRRGDYDVLARLYDRILIFGDRRIYDAADAYRFPDDVAGKVRFCGLLGVSPSRKKPFSAQKGLPSNGAPRIVVTVGGGEDGYPLIRTYLESLQSRPALGKLFQHLIVTGPYMPRPRKIGLMKRYGHLPNIYIRDFVPDIDGWLRTSRLAVSMGGYNTVYEALSLRTPLLVVPRVHPRTEQLIRAERLSALGLLHMMHPRELTPDALGRRLEDCLAQNPRPRSVFRPDFGGIENALQEFRALLPSGMGVEPLAAPPWPASRAAGADGSQGEDR
jgi:predicted glycosyltransferase